MLIAETLCLTFPSSIASKSSGWKGLNLAKTHLLLAQFCLKLCYSSAQMNYLIILSFAANGSLGQWRNHRNPWQTGRDFLSTETTFCQPTIKGDKFQAEVSSAIWGWFPQSKSHHISRVHPKVDSQTKSKPHCRRARAGRLVYGWIARGLTYQQLRFLICVKKWTLRTADSLRKKYQSCLVMIIAKCLTPEGGRRWKKHLHTLHYLHYLHPYVDSTYWTISASWVRVAMGGFFRSLRLSIRGDGGRSSGG